MKKLLFEELKKMMKNFANNDIKYYKQFSSSKKMIK